MKKNDKISILLEYMKISVFNELICGVPHKNVHTTFFNRHFFEMLNL